MANELIEVPTANKSAFRNKNYITISQKNTFDYYRNFLYLNGYPPKIAEVGKFFGKSPGEIKYHYIQLSLAGLLQFDPENEKEPTLTDFTAGMCRVPFKGEITTSDISKTRESLVNFFDLINTPDFFAYRIMADMKFPYYKIGDYIIVCHNTKYADNANLLFLYEDKPLIGRWVRRAHDAIVTNFADGKEIVTNEINIIGEIVGSIRMEIPIEKMFLKGRIKILHDGENPDDVLRHLENQ